MLYVKELKDILSDEEAFNKTSNYYYENHKCEKLNKEHKVYLNYIISSDNSDKVLKLGKCNHCNKVYYTETYLEK